MEPNVFYQERLETIQSDLKALKGRLRLLGTLRLFVFLAAGFGLYFFWGNSPIIAAVLGGALVIFLFLVSRYAQTKIQHSFMDELRKINELELRRLQGDLSDADPGNKYIYEAHDYNQDIDLFGQGSLFQWLNRTALKNGEQTLADWFNSNTIDSIEEKQEAIQELKEWASWRQEYTATAAMIQSEMQAEHVFDWVKNHTAFVPKIYAWLPMAFSAISVGLLIALSLSIIPLTPIIVWFFIGAAINSPYVRKVTKMYNVTSKIDDLLRQYSKLLEKIEQADFKSARLQTWKSEVLTNGRPASATLKELSQHIQALGNRNILLFGFIANIFLLWDLRCAYRIERWMEGFNGALKDWFTNVERFDAMNSLANFAFNNPNYIYPKISKDSNTQLSATELGHPLLNPDKIVKNDISLKHEDFFIITGANMAGKSTFLRTVAMNIVMANSGLPVCAASFEYIPVKLISSMRTSDSLVNDESYFFSELKRLKYIVNKLESDTYFIILDEILKGTNSVDKAEGSKKFVERLVKSKSTGLIATHDLSLCTLADTYSEIQNHYFDAEIVDNELYFDYRFKDGICQNMNASFLLKKMGIVDA
ncbi:MAG: MutS family DNA mismatch repair protein [Crocinitomicaceae bacterium]